MAGYCVKKMTSSDDARLNGRRPEFARMSLCPGLGAGVAESVSSTILKHGLPVPTSLRHGSRIMPLGRYLRRKVREAAGLPQEQVPPDERLQMVRSVAWSSDRSVSEVWKECTEPQALQVEKQMKAKRRSL